MKKSGNEQVRKFLDELGEVDSGKYEIFQKLRSAVFRLAPKVTERIIYGGIMFTLQDDFGGIFPRTKHVSFEFGKGFLMSDPQTVLEGKGKYRRHLKIRSLSDIRDKDVSSFVKQAIELDR